MTKDEQRQLLDNFIDQVKDRILERSDKWPDDWDGFELRWLAQEAFNYECSSLGEKTRNRKRYREFRNAVLVNNLY